MGSSSSKQLTIDELTMKTMMLAQRKKTRVTNLSRTCHVAASFLPNSSPAELLKWIQDPVLDSSRLPLDDLDVVESFELEVLEADANIQTTLVLPSGVRIAVRLHGEGVEVGETVYVNIRVSALEALSDLSEIGTLGVGTFGRVKLVEHKSTGQKFALKTMRKKQLIALKQVEHVMNEKTLLAQCNHPFLINLKGMCQWAPLHLSCLLARSLTVRVCTSSLSISGAFQDRVELYMVLELALGGELFSLLRDKIRFDENMTRFYAACVISAFIHLHDQSIAYRYC